MRYLDFEQASCEDVYTRILELTPRFEIFVVEGRFSQKKNHLAWWAAVPCMPEDGVGTTVIHYDPAIELDDRDITVTMLKHRLFIALVTIDACYEAAKTDACSSETTS